MPPMPPDSVDTSGDPAASRLDQLLQVSANALHAQVPTAEVLQLTAQVFRQEIARQLGDRPLHSRELWRQMSLQSRQE